LIQQLAEHFRLVYSGPGTPWLVVPAAWWAGIRDTQGQLHVETSVIGMIFTNHRVARKDTQAVPNPPISAPPGSMVCFLGTSLRWVKVNALGVYKSCRSVPGGVELVATGILIESRQNSKVGSGGGQQGPSTHPPEPGRSAVLISAIVRVSKIMVLVTVVRFRLQSPFPRLDIKIDRQKTRHSHHTNYTKMSFGVIHGVEDLIRRQGGSSLMVLQHRAQPSEAKTLHSR